MIKVAISQRIIPHYRVPVFRELASRKNIDLTVFYGFGFKNGSQANSNGISGFKYLKLLTLKLIYQGIYKSPQLRVWHPTLFFHLVFRNFDVIITEPSTNFYNNISIFIYSFIFRKKIIWHDAGSVEKNKRPLFRRLIDPILSIMIKNSDAYLTYNSFADTSLYRDHKINPKKIFRAQNTIDTDLINKQIKSYSPGTDSFRRNLNLHRFKTILYIGGLEKRKKIDYLLKIVKKLNEKNLPTKALIVGDGPDKERLKFIAENDCNSNAVFFGKKIKDKVKYILISDIVVLPSSGGLSVVDALICGKPFVGSKEIEHGGICDYIDHGVNGFLFNEDNLNQLYNYSYELLTNKYLYENISKNALIKSQDLSLKKMVDGYVNSIKFVMDEY